jgi:hypothetical protein
MPIDYSKYPPNWLTEIRPRILKRDKNKCKFCNVPNKRVIFRGFYVDPMTKNNIEVYQDFDGRVFSADNSMLLFKDHHCSIDPLSGNENQKAIKVVLTIAHLDHDEWNHDVKDERLAALCQRCHLRYDAKDRAKRRAKKKYKNSLFPIK